MLTYRQQFLPLTARTKGFALVLVLWVLSLLSLMSGSFAVSMRRETSITEGTKSNAQAIAVAESGVAIAEYMMVGTQTDSINADQDKSWRADGGIYQINYGHNGTGSGNTLVRIRMFAETGKIDINQADAKLLRALFMRAPLPKQDRKNPIDPRIRAAKLAAAVLDWRDGDDTVSPEGAEKPEYRAAGLKYQPRNRGFQNIEELQMVMGMDAETFQWLEPLITVYSGQAQVDKTASREVLSVLPGVDAGVIEQFLLARLESAKFSRPLKFPLSSTYINGAEGSDVAQSSAITIISEAKLPDGSRAAVAALVMKSDLDPLVPFQTLKWQRSYGNEISLFSTTMNGLVVAQYNEPQFYD